MIHIEKEEKMLRRLQQKDESALEWIIDRYAPYVSTIIGNIAGHWLRTADVEEIASDVFLTLWLKGERIENGKLKAYLGAVARNKAKERLRSLGQEVPLEEDAIFIADSDPQREMEEKEQAAFLRQAILAMEFPDKELFLRHYYYYQSVAQIARETGLTESNVKIRLHRGRKKLKQLLCKGGYFVETEHF